MAVSPSRPERQVPSPGLDPPALRRQQFHHRIEIPGRSFSTRTAKGLPLRGARNEDPDLRLQLESHLRDHLEFPPPLAADRRVEPAVLDGNLGAGFDAVREIRDLGFQGRVD